MPCLIVALAAVAAPAPSSRADVASVPPVPALDEPPRVFVSGVNDDFAKTRAAVAAAKQASGRDYRVVVVDSAGDGRGGEELLERIVTRWREQSRGGDSGFNPAGDVTIVLDVGDRQIAMDVPSALEASFGLDQKTLESKLIAQTFLPRATRRPLRRGSRRTRQRNRTMGQDVRRDAAGASEEVRIFKTRTLPLGLAGLGAAGLLGGLMVQWARHDRRMRIAREKLAAFKGEVVSLSDLLDGQQERHRMLPHSDPDFKTPMQGMTRSTYDNVQGAIRRYRERWLGLMDVWETVQQKIDSEWFLGTNAVDEAVKLLDSAEARPPLADVAGECRAPLDALEQAHEQAREAATSLDAEIAAATARLEGIARRGRSNAVFQAVLADASRNRHLSGTSVETDPIAARGGLEDARSALAATVGRIDAFEAADDRRQKAATHTSDLVQKVRRSPCRGLAARGARRRTPTIVCRRRPSTTNSPPSCSTPGKPQRRSSTSSRPSGPTPRRSRWWRASWQPGPVPRNCCRPVPRGSRRSSPDGRRRSQPWSGWEPRTPRARGPTWPTTWRGPTTDSRVADAHRRSPAVPLA